MKVYLVMYNQYSAYSEYLGAIVMRCFANRQDAESWIEENPCTVYSTYWSNPSQKASIATIEVEERNKQ